MKKVSKKYMYKTLDIIFDSLILYKKPETAFELFQQYNQLLEKNDILIIFEMVLRNSSSCILDFLYACSLENKVYVTTNIHSSNLYNSDHFWKLAIDEFVSNKEINPIVKDMFHNNFFHKNDNDFLQYCLEKNSDMVDLFNFENDDQVIILMKTKTESEKLDNKIKIYVKNGHIKDTSSFLIKTIDVLVNFYHSSTFIVELVIHDLLPLIIKLEDPTRLQIINEFFHMVIFTRYEVLLQHIKITNWNEFFFKEHVNLSVIIHLFWFSSCKKDLSQILYDNLIHNMSPQLRMKLFQITFHSNAKAKVLFEIFIRQDPLFYLNPWFSIKTCSKSSPLHYSSKFCEWECNHYLITKFTSKDKLDVNITNDFWYTPIEMSISNPNTEVFKLYYQTSYLEIINMKGVINDIFSKCIISTCSSSYKNDCVYIIFEDPRPELLDFFKNHDTAKKNISRFVEQYITEINKNTTNPNIINIVNFLTHIYEKDGFFFMIMKTFSWNILHFIFSSMPELSIEFNHWIYNTKSGAYITTIIENCSSDIICNLQILVNKLPISSALLSSIKNKNNQRLFYYFYNKLSKFVKEFHLIKIIKYIVSNEDLFNHKQRLTHRKIFRFIIEKHPHIVKTIVKDDDFVINLLEDFYVYHKLYGDSPHQFLHSHISKYICSIKVLLHLLDLYYLFQENTLIFLILKNIKPCKNTLSDILLKLKYPITHENFQEFLNHLIITYNFDLFDFYQENLEKKYPIKQIVQKAFKNEIISTSIKKLCLQKAFDTNSYKNQTDSALVLTYISNVYLSSVSQDVFRELMTFI